MWKTSSAVYFSAGTASHNSKEARQALDLMIRQDWLWISSLNLIKALQSSQERLINYWQAGYEEIPLDCGYLVTELKAEEWLNKACPRTCRKEMDSHYCRGSGRRTSYQDLEDFSSEIMMSFPQRSFGFRWSDTCLRWVEKSSPKRAGKHLWTASHWSSRHFSFCLLPGSPSRVHVSTGSEGRALSTRTHSLKLWSQTE